MKILFSPYFILSFALYMIIFLLKKNGLYYDSFFMNHLSDLLCLPVVLSICLELLYYTNKLEKLTVPMILLAWLLFSIVFELILPEYSLVYTKDYIDIFYYGLGGIIFYFMQKGKLPIEEKTDTL